HEFHGGRVRLKDAEKGGVEVERQRRQHPDRHQNDLALEIVADLDFLLVLVGRLIYHVVIFRLEEEVTELAAGHGQEPADQRRHRRVLEHHCVGKEKAYGADQVQRLVDPAMMVIAMIVPPLHSQGFEKAPHISSPCCTWMSMLCRGYGDSMNPV